MERLDARAVALRDRRYARDVYRRRGVRVPHFEARLTKLPHVALTQRGHAYLYWKWELDVLLGL